MPRRTFYKLKPAGTVCFSVPMESMPVTSLSARISNAPMTRQSLQTAKSKDRAQVGQPAATTISNTPVISSAKVAREIIATAFQRPAKVLVKRLDDNRGRTNGAPHDGKVAPIPNDLTVVNHVDHIAKIVQTVSQIPISNVHLSDDLDLPAGTSRQLCSSRKKAATLKLERKRVVRYAPTLVPLPQSAFVPLVVTPKRGKNVSRVKSTNNTSQISATPAVTLFEASISDSVSTTPSLTARLTSVKLSETSSTSIESSGADKTDDAKLIAPVEPVVEEVQVVSLTSPPSTMPSQAIQKIRQTVFDPIVLTKDIIKLTTALVRFAKPPKAIEQSSIVVDDVRQMDCGSMQECADSAAISNRTAQFAIESYNNAQFRDAVLNASTDRADPSSLIVHDLTMDDEPPSKRAFSYYWDKFMLTEKKISDEELCLAHEAGLEKPRLILDLGVQDAHSDDSILGATQQLTQTDYPEFYSADPDSLGVSEKSALHMEEVDNKSSKVIEKTNTDRTSLAQLGITVKNVSHNSKSQMIKTIRRGRKKRQKRTIVMVGNDIAPSNNELNSQNVDVLRDAQASTVIDAVSNNVAWMPSDAAPDVELEMDFASTSATEPLPRHFCNDPSSEPQTIIVSSDSNHSESPEPCQESTYAQTKFGFLRRKREVTVKKHDKRHMWMDFSFSAKRHDIDHLKMRFCKMEEKKDRKKSNMYKFVQDNGKVIRINVTAEDRQLLDDMSTRHLYVSPVKLSPADIKAIMQSYAKPVAKAKQPVVLPNKTAKLAGPTLIDVPLFGPEIIQAKPSLKNGRGLATRSKVSARVEPSQITFKTRSKAASKEQDITRHRRERSKSTSPPSFCKLFLSDDDDLPSIEALGLFPNRPTQQQSEPLAPIKEIEPEDTHQQNDVYVGPSPGVVKKNSSFHLDDCDSTALEVVTIPSLTQSSLETGGSVAHKNDVMVVEEVSQPLSPVEEQPNIWSLLQKVCKTVLPSQVINTAADGASSSKPDYTIDVENSKLLEKLQQKLHSVVASVSMEGIEIRKPSHLSTSSLDYVSKQTCAAQSRTDFLQATLQPTRSMEMKPTEERAFMAEDARESDATIQLCTTASTDGARTDVRTDAWEIDKGKTDQRNRRPKKKKNRFYAIRNSVSKQFASDDCDFQIKFDDAALVPVITQPSEAHERVSKDSVSFTPMLGTHQDTTRNLFANNTLSQVTISDDSFYALKNAIAAITVGVSVPSANARQVEDGLAQKCPHTDVPLATPQTSPHTIIDGEKSVEIVSTGPVDVAPRERQLQDVPEDKMHEHFMAPETVSAAVIRGEECTAKDDDADKPRKRKKKKNHFYAIRGGIPAAAFTPSSTPIGDAEQPTKIYERIDASQSDGAQVPAEHLSIGIPIFEHQDLAAVAQQVPSMPLLSQELTYGGAIAEDISTMQLVEASVLDVAANVEVGPSGVESRRYKKRKHAYALKSTTGGKLRAHHEKTTKYNARHNSATSFSLEHVHLNCLDAVASNAALALDEHGEMLNIDIVNIAPDAVRLQVATNDDPNVGDAVCSTSPVISISQVRSLNADVEPTAQQEVFPDEGSDCSTEVVIALAMPRTQTPLLTDANTHLAAADSTSTGQKMEESVMLQPTGNRSPPDTTVTSSVSDDSDADAKALESLNTVRRLDTAPSNACFSQRTESMQVLPMNLVPEVPQDETTLNGVFVNASSVSIAQDNVANESWSPLACDDGSRGLKIVTSAEPSVTHSNPPSVAPTNENQVSLPVNSPSSPAHPHLQSYGPGTDINLNSTAVVEGFGDIIGTSILDNFSLNDFDTFRLSPTPCDQAQKKDSFLPSVGESPSDNKSICESSEQATAPASFELPNGQVSRDLGFSGEYCGLFHEFGDDFNILDDNVDFGRNTLNMASSSRSGSGGHLTELLPMVPVVSPATSLQQSCSAQPANSLTTTPIPALHVPLAPRPSADILTTAMAYANINDDGRLDVPLAQPSIGLVPTRQPFHVNTEARYASHQCDVVPYQAPFPVDNGRGACTCNCSEPFFSPPSERPHMDTYGGTYLTQQPRLIMGDATITKIKQPAATSPAKPYDASDRRVAVSRVLSGPGNMGSRCVLPGGITHRMHFGVKRHEAPLPHIENMLGSDSGRKRKSWWEPMYLSPSKFRIHNDYFPVYGSHVIPAQTVFAPLPPANTYSHLAIPDADSRLPLPQNRSETSASSHQTTGPSQRTTQNLYGIDDMQTGSPARNAVKSTDGGSMKVQGLSDIVAQATPSHRSRKSKGVNSSPSVTLADMDPATLLAKHGAGDDVLMLLLLQSMQQKKKAAKPGTKPTLKLRDVSARLKKWLDMIKMLQEKGAESCTDTDDENSQLAGGSAESEHDSQPCDDVDSNYDPDNDDEVTTSEDEFDPIYPSTSSYRPTSSPRRRGRPPRSSSSNTPVKRFVSSSWKVAPHTYRGVNRRGTASLGKCQLREVSPIKIKRRYQRRQQRPPPMSNETELQLFSKLSRDITATTTLPTMQPIKRRPGRPPRVKPLNINVEPRQPKYSVKSPMVTSTTSLGDSPTQMGQAGTAALLDERTSTPDFQLHDSTSPGGSTGAECRNGTDNRGRGSPRRLLAQGRELRRLDHQKICKDIKCFTV